MARSAALVMAYLLGVGLSSVLSFARSDTSLNRPQLIGCVFIERESVTCRWEHNKTSVTNYTLSIWELWDKANSTQRINLKNCSSTESRCTVPMTGLPTRVVYCIEVTAHTGSGNISSEPRCQCGRNEVKLPAVQLKSVTPQQGSSHCLNLKWSEPNWIYFPMSKNEIQNKSLNSQIEFTAEGEPHAEVKDVDVTDFTFLACGFRPDTSYSIRLRHRFLGEASPWSEWSPRLQGRTGEAAPSIAPVFWRHIEENLKSGLRRVTLLWKPVPPSLANGRVRFYNVTCRTDSLLDVSVTEGCRHLDVAKNSCSLYLPVKPCSCALTASTSGGKSPEARLWFHGASEAVPAALGDILLRPLNDSSVEVDWTAAVDRSVSGFVVEWCAEEISRNHYWEKVGQSTTTLVITEGIKPLERYAVSVRALYGDKQMAGGSRTRFIYTREGAPSRGPQLTAQKFSSTKVELSWSPLPVEDLNGFLQNYTLFITAANNQTTNESVPGHYVHHTLENLSPGTLSFSMRANTGGGAGRVGDVVKVLIDAEPPIVAYALLTLAATALVAALLVYLTYRKMVNKKLFKYIPDPSNSTLSHWTPKTKMEKNQTVVPEELEVKVSEVVLLTKVVNSDPDLEQSHQETCDVQMHSSKTSSLQIDIAQHVLLRRLAGLKTASVTDLPTHPFVLSDMRFPPALKDPSTPLLSSSYSKFSALGCDDTKQPPGGATEPFAPFLKQHQSLCSLSKFSSAAPSSASVPPPAEFSSAKHPFSPTTFNSFLSLHPITSAPPGITSPFQPFSDSLFVDFSYCPVQCDPYIPYDT